MRRLSSESTKNTYSTLNVTVGTVEEVDRDSAGEMRPQERPPCRRRRPTGSARPLRHVLGHRVLADVVAELGQFSGDAPTAPRRVLPGHALDQLDHLCRERRTAARPSLYAQNLPKPQRCHAITFAGLTTASTSAHRDQTRETRTQKARSMGRRGGRGRWRLSTASCCRSTRISATRLARGRKAATSAPGRAETIANTTGDVDADRGSRHGRIAATDRVELTLQRCVFSQNRPSLVSADPRRAKAGSPNS